MMEKDKTLYYRGIRKYIWILCQIVIRTVFWKKRSLIKKIVEFTERILQNRNKVGCITASGRVALHRLFLQEDNQYIILPEYICNVVLMAAQGKKILYYTINNEYNIDYECIKRYLAAYEGCCILLPSYLNRECKIDEALCKIREWSKTCKIIFDECQNYSSIMSLPAFDNNTYAVYSYNNKTTFGFLGGIIIHGLRNDSSLQIEESSLFRDELHGLYVFVRMAILDISHAVKKKYPQSHNYEVSLGRGIYSVDYKGCLKVSLAAASLIEKYLSWYLYCIEQNGHIISQLSEEKIIEPISGYTKMQMPYLPINNKTTTIRGLQYKGEYGGLQKQNIARNQCIVLSNTMLLVLKE